MNNMEKLIELVTKAAKSKKDIYIMSVLGYEEQFYVAENEKEINILVNDYFNLQSLLKNFTLMSDINYTWCLQYDDIDEDFYIFGFETR